jgi:hypothetical protein
MIIAMIQVHDVLRHSVALNYVLTLHNVEWQDCGRKRFFPHLGIFRVTEGTQINLNQAILSPSRNIYSTSRMRNTNALNFTATFSCIKISEAE